MRGGPKRKLSPEDTARGKEKDEAVRNRRDSGGRNSFGWSKKRVPTSRSGRVVKGRGVFVSTIKETCKTYHC